MTCKTTQLLLVEYGDGGLGTARRAQVEAHLATCPPCARLAREQAAARALLHALPRRQTSAQFEARLAARLAQSHRVDAQAPWWRALADGLRRPPAALRPALALGAALIAVAGTLAYHPAATVAPPEMPAVDTALISQCVALHQRDVAAQPLSDPAAQTVAAQQGAWDGGTTANATLGGSL